MSHNGHTIKLKEVLKATGAKDWKEAIVRLGYSELFGLDPDDLFDFILKIEKPEQVRRILSLIPEYRAFDGSAVGEFLAQLMENGRIMYIEFGRRLSPELHVFMKKPEQDRQVMTAMLQQFEPSELEEFGPWGIRAWWG